MISYLKGKVINKIGSFVIIEVSGVGYKVFLNSSFILEFEAGGEIEIYTYQHVKEDILALYGFRNVQELELFEMLLSISGIGPKSAVSVLAIASVGSIKSSIASGDTSLLVKVSGIGKKTAERVVLELKDKMAKIVTEANLTDGDLSSGAPVLNDEIDALVSLGYSLQQAREVLLKVDPSITDFSERIKEALRVIN